MNQNELEKIRENHSKVESDIAQRSFYLEIKEQILLWAKKYSEHKEVYLYDLLPNLMTQQKLSRLQAYVLVGLIADLIHDAAYMNDDIDSIIDGFYCAINGECLKEQVLIFPDDPKGEDHQHYAWSNQWKLWSNDK